jgi:dynein heavy chain
MSGSCKECQPVKAEGQDDVYLYTFLHDVAARPEMRDLAVQVQNNVTKSITNMKKFLLRFKKYKSLWKADKSGVCEKFASKMPSIVAYDEKMLFYMKTIEEIQQLPKFKDIEFIRLSMRSVCESIANHAKEWMKCLAQQLNESARKMLHEIKTRLDTLESDLNHETDTLEELKFVLRTISNIQAASDTIEEQLREIKERYRTLEMYKIEITPEEKEVLVGLDTQWADLFMNSKHRDVGLGVIKVRFTEITADQISDFSSKVKAYAEKFALHGPGSVGDDLDGGVKLLKVYKDELTRIEHDKQELTNAERLFNLPISNYAALWQVQKEMKGLEDLYRLYEDQKKTRHEWSETLWRDLNVQILVEGTEGFIKTLKKMPRDVKAMPVARTIENRLKSFKEALPLFTDLKHEALRER